MPILCFFPLIFNNTSACCKFFSPSRVFVQRNKITILKSVGAPKQQHRRAGGLPLLTEGFDDSSFAHEAWPSLCIGGGTTDVCGIKK